MDTLLRVDRIVAPQRISFAQLPFKMRHLAATVVNRLYQGTSDQSSLIQ